MCTTLPQTNSKTDAIFVGWNEYAISSSTPLYTTGIASCIAVVGRVMRGVPLKNCVYLTHLTADWSQDKLIGNLWTELPSDLSDVHIVISKLAYDDSKQEQSGTYKQNRSLLEKLKGRFKGQAKVCVSPDTTLLCTPGLELSCQDKKLVKYSNYKPGESPPIFAPPNPKSLRLATGVKPPY